MSNTIIPMYGFGGGGTSSDLNFAVKAYSTESGLLSDSPKDNTIGIVTDTAITGYTISYIAPSSASEGDVWIGITNTSTVEFNALNKNSLQVCPYCVEQYINGEWTGVVFKIYQNGEWTGFFHATINITYPVGSVCTAKCGNIELTAPDTDSGKWLCVVPNAGTWNITSAYNDQSVYTNIEIQYDGQIENIVISYFATINITYPVGSVVTVTNGITNMTNPDDSGTYKCTVPNAGVWTISLDRGFLETATITEYGQIVNINKWHLYNFGDECKSITGGWNISAKNWNTSVGYANLHNLTYNSDSMVVSYTGNGGSILANNNAVNINGFSKLHANINQVGGYNTNFMSMRVWIAYPSYIDQSGQVLAIKSTGGAGSNNDLSCSIETIGGTRTIGFCLYTANSVSFTFTVREVWLEV